MLSLRIVLPLFLLVAWTQALFWPSPPSPISTDTFYHPPAGYESAAPGTVLRSRTITPAIFMNIRAMLFLETFQLLYRTTGLNGRPIVAVTTVFVPSMPGRTQKDRLIAYDVFTDSAAPQCAASYGFQELSHQNNILLNSNLEIIQAYLFMGWTVVASDHDGPDSALCAGRLNGMISLDGVKAALSFEPSRLSKDAKIVGQGYSTGALATGWAASLASSYASELNYVGWAMGGMPADLAAFLTNIDKKRTAGLITATLAGLSAPSAYPQLGKLLAENVTPKGKAELESAKKECAVSNIRHMHNESILSTEFSSLGSGLLQEAAVAGILEENKLGKDTPQAPVLVYHSNVDEMVPYSTATDLVQTWCHNGARVTFNTYTDSNHLTLFIRPLRNVIEFIQTAFDGTAATSCTKSTIPKSPFTLPMQIQPLLANFDDLLDEIYNGA